MGWENVVGVQRLASSILEHWHGGFVSGCCRRLVNISNTSWFLVSSALGFSLLCSYIVQLVLEKYLPLNVSRKLAS